MSRDRTTREERFWQIVESESFREAFAGRHPLIRDHLWTYGRDFYQVANLQRMIVDLHLKKREPGNPNVIALMDNTINERIDWLEQSRWVNTQLDEEGYLPSWIGDNDNCSPREQRFWEIAESESFKTAFAGYFPMFRENIRWNDEHFYDVDNLRRILADIRAAKMKTGNPKIQWHLNNSIRVKQDWILQSQWINAKLDLEGF